MKITMWLIASKKFGHILLLIFFSSLTNENTHIIKAYVLSSKEKHIKYSKYTTFIWKVAILKNLNIQRAVSHFSVRHKKVHT